MPSTHMRKALITIFLILLIDQISKFWIKTNMFIGEEFFVLGDWFRIRFIENNGMAFGMEFAGANGKIFLSLFRIAASGAIIYYLYNLIKKKANQGLIITVSLILAGALGNIIDSIFYGVIFSESCFMQGNVAELFPADGGYAGFLQGKVVDMLYFPLFEGHFPEWVPFWGGEDFLFFRPIFNISDSAITIGVFLLVIFQKRFFHKHEEAETVNNETAAVHSQSDDNSTEI